MKEIFIGSSKEGLEQATQVAAVLSEAQDVNGDFLAKLVYASV